MTRMKLFCAEFFAISRNMLFSPKIVLTCMNFVLLNKNETNV